MPYTEGQVRTRRLLTRIVAAAFVLLSMQQFVSMPQLRASTRIEQRLARSSTDRKWREVVPAPAAVQLSELATELPARYSRVPTPVNSEPSALRRFQRPPPTV